MIFLDTKNAICPRPSAPQILPISICIVETKLLYGLIGLTLTPFPFRLAEFHTELELLPVKEIQNNIYLKHPVSMEQYLMEGSYNKVFLAKGNVPAESYIFFVDILLKTIRLATLPKSLDTSNESLSCSVLALS